MNVLDPYKIPLESTNLIEASAGTGKSWTVSLLVLRYILEKELTLDQILVVTFTEAATKELRDAIRVRIIEALDFFKDPTQELDQVEYKTLYEKHRHGSDVEAIQRLNLARLSIDEAAIFTIHGFCQRTLTEYAFEAGLPFESELLDDDSELMQQLVDDFWRKKFLKAPRALLFKLKAQNITPDSLLSDIRNAVGKPYLKMCKAQNIGLNDNDWKSLESHFHQAMELWKKDSAEIIELMFSKDLHGGKYRKATVEKNCIQMSLIETLQDINFNLLSKDLKRFKTSSLIDATKDKCITPEHPFFDLWESFSNLYELLVSASDSYLSNIRVDLIKYLQQELPKEKNRLGLLSFDDLLLNLQQAISNHPKLADALSIKYQAALIDEFQDTDPVQYSIFNSIYADSETASMFLVGDPKQAIYNFRGGDIHTYLKAKANTKDDNQYTIKTNYRSHPKLIDAFNTLYANTPDAFREDHIKYVEVNSGAKDTNERGLYKSSAPLRFWNMIPEVDDKGATIGGMDRIKRQISDAVAGEIAQTLNNKSLDVIGSDISILVRSHSQGQLIKDALNRRNIASVQSGKDSIFETHEAEELFQVLRAIVEPQHENLVRRALVTELIACTAKDLLHFDDHPDEWDKQLSLMQQWTMMWKQKGFLVMFKDFMQQQSIHKKLLMYVDGERRLTNLLQLSELIHTATKQHSLSMEEVLRWLRQQRDKTGNTQSELRLESDEKLVKIVTIWKSKGLEYPIVYCPFIGLNRPDFKETVFSFYKDEVPCLEIGSDNFDDHKALKTMDENAEDARLLYVALTRAKNQCTVVSFPEPIKGSPDRSALSWLLSKGETIENKKSFITNYQETLKELEQSPNIEVTELPYVDPTVMYLNEEEIETLSSRNFTKNIISQSQITSFSGLTADAHNESPDHDASASDYIQLPKITEDEFPRGATAGSALHEVYENIDFTQPIEAQQEVIQLSLSKWGYDEKHLDAVNILMNNSLNAPITSSFSLGELENKHRLNEMEFHLPLENLAIKDLKQVLFKHLPQNKNWQFIRGAVDTLQFDQVKGYLKGFIDLIFIHENQYYIADYKSNSLLDYQSDSLFPVMAESHYYLQYFIYSVALHRYLKKRIPGYQWDTHMGGSYYLFIRGMKKSNTSQLSDGVFFDKPRAQLIEALDTLFSREESYV